MSKDRWSTELHEKTADAYVDIKMTSLGGRQRGRQINPMEINSARAIVSQAEIQKEAGFASKDSRLPRSRAILLHVEVSNQQRRNQL